MANGSGTRAAGHAVEPATTAWRITGAGLLAVWLLIGVVYWSTLSTMVLKWYESGTFAHGFLIPPVALYFAWRSRRAFLDGTPSPALWAAVLLAAAGVLWIVGDLTAVLVVQQLALIAIIELVLLTVVGVRATLTIAFPLFFLWFAVPVGEFMTGPLQDYTAWFVIHALRLSGVPVLVEGRALTVPTGSWLVAEACSGVRYLIPSLVLGVLFSWITFRSWRRRLMFGLLSVFVPIFANGVRAYVIIMLAHYTQNRIAVGIDHLIYGWFFFSVVMGLLFFIGSHWREDEDETPAPAAISTPSMLPTTPARVPLAVVLAAVLALCPPALSSTWLVDTPVKVGMLEAPPVAYPWTLSAAEPVHPRFVGAAAEVSQSYTAGARPVHLYVAYYATERQGEELISDQNNLTRGSSWTLIDARTVEVRLNGAPLEVRQHTLRSRRGQTRVAWIWYSVSGQHTLSPIVAKWLRVKNWLLRRPYVGAAFVLSVDQGATSTAQLQDFLDHCPTLAERSLQTQDRA